MSASNSATKRQQELFSAAYSAAHMAGDTLSLIYDAGLQRERVLLALAQSRRAVSALTTLDHLLAGGSEPKRGE